jgi:hypothetical protein
MNEYQIGQDIADLRHRLEMLEARSGLCRVGITTTLTVPTVSAETSHGEKAAYGVEKYIRWSWGGFSLADANARPVIDVTNLRMVFCGSVIGGVKEAYLFVGGVLKDLVGMNWHVCINASAKKGDTYVASAVGQVIVPSGSAGQPVSAGGSRSTKLRQIDGTTPSTPA